MKKFLIKYKKIFLLLVFIFIIIFIILIKNYKDSNLISEVYYKCDDEFICEYYLLQNNGKVYMVEQHIDNDENKQDNFEKLLLKHGIDIVARKCSDGAYGYCGESLGVFKTDEGIYSINKNRVKIEWDSKYTEDTYYEIKKGNLVALNSDLEITKDVYQPVKKYNKWKKCRKDKNCDEIFSIDDPLNNIDYEYIYEEIEKGLGNGSCSFFEEYAFKDITGDGIKELLVRRSHNEKDWKLQQIYYFNTWFNKILPLGDDKMPFVNTTISDVYENGYIYITGKYIKGDYYKVSIDGSLLEYYEDDLEIDFSDQKSLYENIKEWKSYPTDEEYCNYLKKAKN